MHWRSLGESCQAFHALCVDLEHECNMCIQYILTRDAQTFDIYRVFGPHSVLAQVCEQLQCNRAVMYLETISLKCTQAL